MLTCKTLMFTKESEDYGFLSNFYPVNFVYKDVEYTSVEHFYQSFKTRDMKMRERIRMAKTPSLAKRLGSDKSLVLREDWNDIKFDVMRRALTLKFSNPKLKKKLLKTGEVQLVELTTWHDQIWGICCCHKCGGRGKNMLGKLLMEIRSKLNQGA